MSTQVAIVKCPSYDPALVLAAVHRAIDLIGGISVFIKPGSKVLLKPNLLMAKDPCFGIDTHPQVVRAITKILKEIDCTLFLGDGPSVWGNQIENVDEVYRRAGMQDLCADEGVQLVKFDKKRWRGEFPFTAWLDECDYVVNLPKLKTHGFTLMTAAIKNLFGLIPGTYKTELHKNYFRPEDFSRMLVDIYQEIKPTLTLVDGIVAMEGEGPATAGKLRNLGLLFAGRDCVALDSIIALVMGVKPLDILTTKEAAVRGLGIADTESISILGEKLEAIIPQPFILPATSFKKNIPQPILEIARKLIKYYPYVKQINCILCGACVKACPKKVISAKKGRIVINYKGCISCFCCQEACPHSAIKVKKSLLAKIIGL